MRYGADDDEGDGGGGGGGGYAGDAEPAAESGEKSDTPEEDAFIETETSMHDARRADTFVSALADDGEHCFKMHVAFLGKTNASPWRRTVPKLICSRDIP